MTREQDLERDLSAWLLDGPTSAPPEILDATLHRLEQRGQRPSLQRRLRAFLELPATDRPAGARLLRVIVLTLLMLALLISLLLNALPIASGPERADGFAFEEVGPGVRRLVTDGAGHFPSAPYIREARDMDRLTLDETGRIVVWSTAHGVDNQLGFRAGHGSCQRWTVGVPGVEWLVGDECAPAMALAQAGLDGDAWSEATDKERGLVHTDLSSRQRFLAGRDVAGIAIARDGRVWVAVGHPDGAAGGIFVIEPDAQGDPLGAWEPPETKLATPSARWLPSAAFRPGVA